MLEASNHPTASDLTLTIATELRLQNYVDHQLLPLGAHYQAP